MKLSLSSFTNSSLAKPLQVHLLLLCVFVFFLPTIQQLSILALGILAIIFIVTGKIKSSLQFILNERILLISVIYYLIHVVGLIYTENFHYAFRDLEAKLAFLLFPFLLPLFRWDQLNFRTIQRYFIAGNLLAVIICFLIAVYRYNSDHLADHFFYSQYSLFAHPTYFSMYLTLSLLFLIEEWFSQSQNNKTTEKILILICFFLFFLNIQLLSSRTSIVVSYLTVMFFVILRKGKSKEKVRQALKLLPAILLVVFSQFFVLHLNNRFLQVEQAIQSHENSTETLAVSSTDSSSEANNSTNARVFIWKSSVELIREHPLFGVGTGDIHNELESHYLKNNFEFGIRKHLNAHNQFLNTAIVLGIPGVLILFAWFFFPAWISAREKDWLYFSFLLVVIINSMTESILEVQKGILFAVFFQLAFYLSLKSKTMSIGISK